MEDKTPFQKAVTEWTFSQSTGIVMAMVCISMMFYWNYGLTRRIEILEAQVKEQITFQRDMMKATIEPNTRALNENNRLLEEFNIYQRYKSLSK